VSSSYLNCSTIDADWINERCLEQWQRFSTLTKIWQLRISRQASVNSVVQLHDTSCWMERFSCKLRLLNVHDVLEIDLMFYCSCFEFDIFVHCFTRFILLVTIFQLILVIYAHDINTFFDCWGIRIELQCWSCDVKCRYRIKIVYHGVKLTVYCKVPVLSDAVL
jgi:hypothetical protein